MKNKPINSNWTDEQWEAIVKDNENILVSAGAGSGKTAVLTERVIEKIKNNISINNLIIITFTNAAAFEMKTRIKKGLIKLIKEEPKYKEQLRLLDQALITTYDGLSLYLVKKYHYLLGIDKSVSIIDDVDLSRKKEMYIDEIFDKYYENDKFLELLSKFTTKDDKSIKNIIKEFYDKIDVHLDKNKYLDEYFNNYYTDTSINKILDDYMNLLSDKKDTIINLIDHLEEYNCKEKVIDNYKNAYSNLKDATTYEEYKNSIPEKNISQDYKNMSEEEKSVLEKYNKTLSGYIKELKELTKYTSLSEIKEEVLSTKDDVHVIISILKELEEKLNNYKKQVNSYTFSDITRLATKILDEFDDIRESIKNNTNEIMIDEYQDTNKIGDEFIKRISNNNIYMVGDVKQSIYRFRKAEPKIFMDKYDKYQNNHDGYLINLSKNFRSRNEVLEDINLIFERIMDTNVGGADYTKGHQMNYGLLKYNEETSNNNHLEIYNYDLIKNNLQEEIEATIISSDIKEKIDKSMKIFDKDLGFRDITYKDFSIIAATKTSFETYKKVLDFYGIPTTLYMSPEFSSSDEIYVIRNILRLINNRVKGEDIKYPFISIARSYLFNYDDNKIFESVTNNTIEKDFEELIKRIDKLILKLDEETLSSLLISIYEEFDMYSKSIRLGDIETINYKLDYLVDVFKNLEDLDYDLDSVIEYLNDLYEGKLDIKFDNKPDSTSNTVKIMSIHTSKGLEYPVCYFPDLKRKFNIQDVKSSFLYSDIYGFIVPIFKEGKTDTILKVLEKNNYKKESISEEIRKFYVALTRAREKIILIAPINQMNYLQTSFSNIVNKEERLNYKSYLEILLSIKDSLDKYIVDKKYTLVKDYDSSYNLSSLEKIDYNFNEKYLTIEEEDIKNYSHRINKIEKIDNDLGTKAHEVLEYLDFNNYLEDINNYEIDEYIKDKILKLFEMPFMNLNNSKIYKEYEFINNGIKGIIDLMIENDNKIIIVDYKLKDIDEDYYVDQVKGYMDYIKSITNKKVEGYLYSILDERYKVID